MNLIGFFLDLFKSVNRLMSNLKYMFGGGRHRKVKSNQHATNAILVEVR